MIPSTSKYNSERFGTGDKMDITGTSYKIAKTFDLGLGVAGVLFSACGEPPRIRGSKKDPPPQKKKRCFLKETDKSDKYTYYT